MAEQLLVTMPSIPISVANGGTGASTSGAAAANNIGALSVSANLSDVSNTSSALANIGGISGGKLVALNQTSNFTLSLPANCVIENVFINETAGNAITGGIKIGTTSGATDIAVAIAVLGNSIQIVPSAAILKQVFSTVSTQTLFIQTVTLWNSASINVTILYRSL